MVLVWDAAVHRLTCHLLAPLARSAGHCNAGSHLKSRDGQSEEAVGASDMGHALLPDGTAHRLFCVSGDHCLGV